MQERILRIERELPGLPQFNLPFAYRLQGPLNVSALERSFVEIVRRHESLRTAFTWRDELPVALITPAADIKSSLIVEDLAARASAENSRAKTLLVRMAELEAERECLKPIDVKHAPLFRARLFRLGVNDHVLLLILHDIIIDGWSMGVFMEELSELYAAFTADRTATIARTSASVFRLRALAASVVDQRRSNPTVRLLEGTPEKDLTCVWRRE